MNEVISYCVRPDGVLKTLGERTVMSSSGGDCVTLLPGTGGRNEGAKLKRLELLSDAPTDILRFSNCVLIALGMGGNVLDEAELLPPNGGIGKLLNVNSLCVADGAILERRSSSGRSSRSGVSPPRPLESFAGESGTGDASLSDIIGGRGSMASDRGESVSGFVAAPLAVTAGENRRSAAMDLSSSFC